MSKIKAMAKKRRKLSRGSVRYVQRAGLRLVLWSARPMARVIVIVLLLLVLLWLLFAHVWRPLRQEVPLPPGITLEVPRVDVDSLRSINTMRVERTERARRDFSPFAPLFIGPSQASPDGG